MAKQKNRGGRPVVGIDLGGTNMQIGVVDASNKIIGRKGKKTEAVNGLKHVVKRLVKGVNQACEEAGLKVKDLGAIGIASAGAMDIPRGIVLDSPNLKWHNVPLKKILEDELGRPVVLENDVRGAVWGEYKLGAGKGRGDLLAVWMGTGVGGGLVLNGTIYYGAFFTAGEVGHTIITPDGGPKKRTVEDHCSRTGMARTVLERLPKYKNAPIRKITDGTGKITGSRQFADAVKAKCPLTISVVNEAADLLGTAIANFVTTLSVDTVVIGGGVTEALGKPYVDRIYKSFAKTVFPERCKKCKIMATKLKDNAGLLGAALLARAALE